MKLDDVLESWRSQDQAPLYSVNYERLHELLRQEEAKVQTQRRVEGWVLYVFSPFSNLRPPRS